MDCAEKWTRRDSVLTVRVSDDGRGFNSEVPAPRGHYGLVSISEGAAAVGGSLHVGSRSRGPEVVAVVPTGV